MAAVGGPCENLAYLIYRVLDATNGQWDRLRYECNKIGSEIARLFYFRDLCSRLSSHIEIQRRPQCELYKYFLYLFSEFFPKMKQCAVRRRRSVNSSLTATNVKSSQLAD